MARLPWFPCNPEKFLGALAGLPQIEGYLYVVVCFRIYETGKPCPDTIEVLQRRAGMTKKQVETARAGLLAKGKLVETADGLMNAYASTVLAEQEAIHERLRKAGKEGGKKSAEKRKQKQSNPASPAAPAAKPGNTHLDLEKKDSVGANAPTPPAAPAAPVKVAEPVPVKQEAPDARVYRRGKQVLGDSAGGVIRKLIEHHGGNLALAVASIEQASTKQSPREWIAGILRNKPGQRPQAQSRSGFAALAAAEIFAEEDDHDGPTLDLHATVPAAGDQRVAHIPALPNKRRSR